MTGTPDDNNDIKIEIPDVEKMMALLDRDFAAVAVQHLMRYEMSNARTSFNSNSSDLDLIVTPLGPKSALVYTSVDQSFIEAALLLKSKFEKTGTVAPLQRECFLLELTKATLRDYTALAHNSQNYKDLCEQVMQHVTGKLRTVGSLSLGVYTAQFTAPKIGGIG